ncbi:hypothetical protein CVD25_15760 [Bacillus canaveralius]|uniref:DUF3888 domain-containing protein n=1 Tax=Bacillus canaveralius TaxID=1403243 RepID=A0A2N5GFG8_9BACI|nr:hypothetical protein [Bacillus canaveralius]PLR79514.1 hypothetical protein CU635_22750 [Bacillus canaveralius]PLR94915.1 hypothetical protein CVD25_15760 [Bacillus canaveralius]
MRKLIYVFLIAALINIIAVSTADGEGANSQLMEEVLVKQFHEQISKSIIETYQNRFPQYENATIISINKEALPESSEEMKPGILYEIVLQVQVLLNTGKREKLTIILNNDSSDGQFNVRTVKKGHM